MFELYGVDYYQSKNGVKEKTTYIGAYDSEERCNEIAKLYDEIYDSIYLVKKLDVM